MARVASGIPRRDSCTQRCAVVRETLCFAAGALILLANALDIVWTALGTHGGGPICGPTLSLFWKLAVRLHQRNKHHRLLSFVGSALLLVLLGLWTGLMWLGWFTVFSANPHALVSSQTHQPASVAARIYFTGYSIATLGNGDFMPSSKPWQILTAFMTLSGLGTVSLEITFLLNVLAAVVAQRSLAAYIADLGGKPLRILERAWTGEHFDSLSDHLIETTAMVQMYAEQHLAYPVLHFFHSESERTSPPLQLAALEELVFLLCHGVAEEARLPPMVVLPLQDAMQALAEMLTNEFIKASTEAPPVIHLQKLRDLGIPTVDEKTYAAAAGACAYRRRVFAGLVHDDGSDWSKATGY
jgi:hypothetical protein